MEVDSAPPATNEVPAELLEGAVDISEAKDGGILKVSLVSSYTLYILHILL